jgi:Lrp/AsnC family transcriptional regulator, leucine-responsive regulatory protein
LVAGVHRNGIAIHGRDEICCFGYFGVIITFVLVQKCESDMDDLDRIDRSLLRLLQEDGRRTTLDLARRVGLSPTGAAQRVKRLFAEGFIRAVRAVLDPARIGQAQLVFIEVRLDHTAPHVFDRFADAVLRAPEIIECHMVVGGFDYLVKARIADMAMFQDFLQRVILPLPGVRETHTYASIANVKPDALLPVAP